MMVIGMVSGILVLSFVVVFWPVWSKKGDQPLPVGLEDDPVWELEQRRLVLLAQLKEREWEGDASVAGRISLETELAEVFAQLDGGAALPVSGEVSDGLSRPRWMDKGSSVMIAVVMVLVGVVLYGGLGTSEKKMVGGSTVASPQSSDEMNALLDKAFERLKGEPDNITSWLRLARSFVVMQRDEEAMEAYAFILKHHPQEMQARVGLAGLKVQTAVTDGEVAQGREMFQAILKDDPDNQDALWFLGGMALQTGSVEEAKGYWLRLLERLPPGDANREMVQQALSELQKK